FAPDQPFTELVATVKQTLRQSHENQNFPFSALQSYLRQQFPGFVPPPFEVMVLLHNHASKEKTFQWEGLTVQDLDYKPYNGNFPYTFNFQEAGEALEINLEYSTELFTAQRAEETLGQVATLMASIVANPKAAVRDLTIWTAAQKEQLFQQFSGPIRPIPEGQTFIDLFQHFTEANPDKLALKYEARSHTYQELYAQTTALAVQLKEAHGLPYNRPVPIIADRSDELVLGIMGIILGGAGYVPVEPDLPFSRVHFVLQDIEAQMAIVQRKHAHLLEGTAVKAVILEEVLAAARAHPVTGYKSTATPEDLAYIIYTSGSTGNPKGAMLQHKGMLNHMLAKQDDLQLNTSSVIAQTASASFDISIWQMMEAFMVGGTTVVYDNDVVNVPEVLCRKLREDKVTILEIVPSYMALLQQFGSAEDFKSLEYLIATGEALPYSLVKAWLAEHPDIPMVNAYGPTEVSDDITHAIYHEPPSDGIISIGSPIRNLSLYIVDDWDTLMPMGVKGHILVSGVGVGLGYINNPEKTAHAFGYDHYFDHPDERKLYRTGDIGQWTSEGTLHFFGRSDDQVKVRGYRIELGEIEKNIVRFEEINQAAVVVKKNDQGGLLIAYLTLKEGVAAEATEQIKKALPDYLPDYMVPHHWVVLDQMPLTPNGKINRKELNAYALNTEIEEGQGATQAEQLSGAEQAIYQEWCEVLGHRQFSTTDAFFQVGGDSFKAILLASRLSRTFQTQLSIRKIFEFDSIQAQAGQIQPGAQGLPGIVPQEGIGSNFPLSEVQQGIFHQQMLEAESTQYVIRGTYTVRGRLDTARMESALAQLIERHHILRTGFEVQGDTAIQRVYTSVAVPLHVVTDLAAAQTAKPFDMAQPPLFRVLLVQEGEQIRQVIFEAHHLIADGISIDLLTQELMALYQGQDLPATSLQYTDYLRWKDQEVVRAAHQDQASYWLDQYADHKPALLQLPTHSDSNDMACEVTEVELSAVEHQQLTEYCRAQGITPSNGLLAIFLLLLHKYSGQPEVSLGIPVAGRTQQDMFSIVGPLATLIPYTQSVDHTQTVGALVQGVQAQAVDAYANQDYAYRDLVKATNVRFAADGNTLFHAAYSSEYVQATQEEATRIQLDEHTELRVQEDIPSDLKYQMHLRTYFYQDTARIRMEYRKALFGATTMEQFKGHFLDLLRTVLDNSDQIIQDIDLLGKQSHSTSVLDAEASFNF
ncbi:MAG: amino acid adenylation domain-containing protein, partial [Bacteroidota bacterium]